MKEDDMFKKILECISCIDELQEISLPLAYMKDDHWFFSFFTYTITGTKQRKISRLETLFIIDDEYNLKKINLEESIDKKLVYSLKDDYLENEIFISSKMFSIFFKELWKYLDTGNYSVLLDLFDEYVPDKLMVRMYCYIAPYFIGCINKKGLP